MQNLQLNFIEHKKNVQETRSAHKQFKIDAELQMLNAISKEQDQIIQQRLLCVSRSKAWFKLCYGLRPLHLPHHCDGCGSGFSDEHALNGKNGELVDLHHNEVADEWVTLCGKTLTPTLISHGHTIFN